jgi:hypothetical protein
VLLDLLTREAVVVVVVNHSKHQRLVDLAVQV